MKVQPNGDPDIYLYSKEEQSKSKGEVTRHLMMDEIKLKNVIAFNRSNNEITGFVIDQLNTKLMFENILSIIKKKKTGAC